MRDALFVSDLSSSATPDAQQLRDLTVDAGGIVSRKTVSYRLDLDCGFIGVNLKQSITDGGTLIELVIRAGQVVPPTPRA